MRILITGAVGFIGFHLAKKLLENKDNIVLGLDNISDYYDIGIKHSRLDILKENYNFIFDKIDICDKNILFGSFKAFKPDIVINLAAQAGVRYSMVNPYSYIQTNIVGFLNVLEASVENDVMHFLFASSSSVYGTSKKIPFSVNDDTNHPMSLYGATKKSNEMIAHSYSSMYNFPCTGLRFFSVYGPYGRPDLAMFKFIKNIIADIPIDVYGNGEPLRAYTYVDDVVDCVIKLIDNIPQADKHYNPDQSTSIYPYKIYNIGSDKPIKLNKFIELIEQNLNKKAIKNYLPMQIADIKEAYSDDNNELFKSTVNVEEGVKRFVDWYKEYYHG